MDAVRKTQAKRRVAFGLRHSGGPKAKESSEELSRLPAGSPVYVYRNTNKKWDGPFPFIQIHGETVVVQMPSGRKVFRSNVVRSSVPPLLTNEKLQVRDLGSERPDPDERLIDGDNTEAHFCESANNVPSDEVLTAMFGESGHDYAVLDDKHIFIQSRQVELKGLEERETFKVVKISSVPRGTRIYGSRWVDTIKSTNGKLVEKSRLVAQNYRDKGASFIATRSPTISRMGHRVTVATATLCPDHKSYIRDISQAYLQSESDLERKIFLKAPKEMGLEDDEVLLVTKPLYGVPESGLHWFVTYQTHHKERLGMNCTRGDPCLLFRPGETSPDGLTALQVDDSYGHGTEKFLRDEDLESKRFKCKPRKIISEGDTVPFNGSGISIKECGVNSLDQSDKLEKVSIPETQSDLVSVRAQIQYVGCCTRPDLCAAVQLLASAVTSPVPETYKTMEKVVDRCHETAKLGLNYIPLDRESLRLALFTDASFANADRLKSQLGFVLVLTDGNNGCKHFALWKFSLQASHTFSDGSRIKRFGVWF